MIMMRNRGSNLSERTTVDDCKQIRTSSLWFSPCDDH